MKEAFRELRETLQQSVKDKDHPFRYPVMGTVGLDRMARLRTVVLREVNEDLEFRCYTDRRSKKVTHLKENDKVSMLFYHPGFQLQLKAEGLARVVTEDTVTDPIYRSLHEGATRDYRTSRPPGSTIDAPEQLEYLRNEHHLCILDIRPYKIEYLKLGDPHHSRIRFSRNGTDGWQGEYLVP